MPRPNVAPPSSSVSRRASTRRKDEKTLFKRRLVKQWLRRSGRKHAISMAAFKTVTRMGQQIFARIITTIVRELSQSVKNNRTTITTRHVIHAANMIGLSSALMGEAVEMHKAQRYDVSHYKKSAVRRVFGQYSSKNRVSAQAMSLLWCVVILHLEEVISYNTDLAKPDVNVRIKEENIFNAVSHSCKKPVPFRISLKLRPCRSTTTTRDSSIRSRILLGAACRSVPRPPRQYKRLCCF